MRAEYSVSRDAFDENEIVARGICVSFNKKRDSEGKMAYILKFLRREGWGATAVDEDDTLDFWFSYTYAPTMTLMRDDWEHFQDDYKCAKEEYKEYLKNEIVG